MSIEQVHHHEPNGEEAEENEESPAAAWFGQRAILAHEQARHVDFAVGVGLVVGHIVEYVYCFFLRFLTMARITKNSTTRARSTRMMMESWWLYLVMTEMSAA